MSLRVAIRDARLPVVPRLPEHPQLASQSKRLRDTFETGSDAPKALDAHAVVKRFRRVIETGRWESVTPREWRAAIWVAFSGSAPLCESEEFLSRFIARLRAKAKKSAYKQLIAVYLRDFDPKSRPLRRIAQELDGAVRQFTWSWSRWHDEHELFDPDAGPQRIAHLCLTGDGDPLLILDSVGIGPGRIRAGFAAHAWLRGVAKLGDAFARRRPDLTLLERVLAWSEGEHGLTYPSHRSVLATTLLVPWIDAPPPENLRETLIAFLLKHLKDPRLPINAKEWVGVPEEGVAVLRKWLTRIALEQFFQVVDQAAEERMWHYRRALWSAYDAANAISDAWVLFGPRSTSYATQTFGDSRAYGQLSECYDPTQSVLLMRIGKLTIADWSHNGRCHIWLDGNPSAPKLYLAQYARRYVVYGSDNGGLTHSGSDYGTWQARIEEHIRAHTGISLSPEHYMPKGWRRR